MTAVIAISLILVAANKTAVVFTYDPERQAVTLSALGVLLTILFVALQAPDVALSELGVGAAVVPLMIMLTVRKLRRPK
jgi:energy-converting hydrogenase B subunit D